MGHWNQEGLRHSMQQLGCCMRAWHGDGWTAQALRSLQAAGPS